jgi:hypothetical protein
MHSIRDHLGTRFELRTDQWTWFWRVVIPHRKGGAVGAAATEADAVRDACVAIEEMSAQRREDAPAPRLPTCLFVASVIAREAHREVWNRRLDRVAEYLLESV